MTSSEFDQLVAEKKQVNPIWFDLQADKQVSKLDIINAAESLHCSLPSEYSHFLEHYGGGYFAFVCVYSLDENSSFYLFDNLRNDIPNFLPVSDNGCGDLYGFKIFDFHCSRKVFLYIHDEKIVNDTPYDCFFDFLVAKAFK